MNDLNDLAYFAAVADHGGFAAASRALGIPKSRLSRRIAQLEQQLGVRLLQRTTRRFAVTDLGEAVLRHARAMRQEADAAAALVHERAAMPRGSVRLSCPPALLTEAVGAMLSRFLNAWPLVELQVSATNRNVDVWRDGVDLALRVRAVGATLPADEVVRPLAVSPHLIVCAPRLLTNAAPPATPEALAALPTVGLGNSPEETRWRLQADDGRTATVEHSPRMVADDVAALRCAALDGVGCAVLPQMMVHDALQSGALIQLLPQWTAPAGQIQAAYANRRGMLPAVRLLLDTLVEGFDGMVRQGLCLKAL